MVVTAASQLFTCTLTSLSYMIESSNTSLNNTWDRFREKGPSAYIIKFPVHVIEM